MVIFLIVLLVLFISAFALAWHVFLGQANPPLPRAQLTFQSPWSSPPGTASVSTLVLPELSSTPIAATTTQPITAPAADGVANDPNPSGLGSGQLSIDNAVFDVEIASTPLEQARGLSFRTSLGANQGMLFVFGTGSVQTFWMKDMNFPLDMIWISGNTVVGFAQNDPAEPGVATPTTIYSSPKNTDKVLEVNAGTVAKYGIKVGDRVQIAQ